MSAKLIVKRTSWSFVANCIVSLGSFLLNIQLARGLASADYGSIALLFGAIFALLIVNQSLLIYPLSVRLHHSASEAQPEILGSTASLSAALALLLAGILALGLLLLDRSDLLPAAVLCYLAWHAYETFRCFLFANFQHRSSLIGEATTWGGHVLFIAVLSATGTLTLNTALYAMTAGFLAGAAIHTAHLKIGYSNWSTTLKRARQFVALGSWALANQETHQFRRQIIPWVLAWSTGSAAVAVYQAALNIANLINPILYALNNLLPQAVAQARVSDGITAAWTLARKYILLGLVPVIICSVPGLLLPDFLLHIFYGADSPYHDEALNLQILVLAGAVYFISEMFVQTLLGMEAGKAAMVVNLGALFAAIVTIPLVVTYGVFGACLAFLIANLARLPIAWVALLWVVAEDRPDRMNELERAVS